MTALQVFVTAFENRFLFLMFSFKLILDRPVILGSDKLDSFGPFLTKFIEWNSLCPGFSLTGCKDRLAVSRFRSLPQTKFTKNGDQKPVDILYKSLPLIKTMLTYIL